MINLKGAKPSDIDFDRSTRQSRDRRKLILATALRIASRDGIEGLTIGELAKAVGMSKSGLFAHFGGRDQLQLAVLELAMEQFVDVVLRHSFTRPRGEPRILAVFENWLTHLKDQKTASGSGILIAASTEFDDRPGLLRDFILSAQKSLIANIEKAAAMAIEEGHFQENVDVGHFAWSMYSFVLGYYHFKRMLEDPKAEERLRRSFQDLMDLARTKRLLKPALKAAEKTTAKRTAKSAAKSTVDRTMSRLKKKQKAGSSN